MFWHKKWFQKLNLSKTQFFILFLFVILFGIFYFFYNFFSRQSFSFERDIYQKNLGEKKGEVVLLEEKLPKYPSLDKEDYDIRMSKLANNPTIRIIEKDQETGEEKIRFEEKKTPWPVQNLPYPKDGALLPFNRIIAYYGNLYSKKMGALGEYPEAEMIARLQREVDLWNQADPDTKAIPALHYIAVVAQGAPGKDGKYKTRMPDTEIEKVLKMAEKINAIVFLDVQVGNSTIYDELPYFEKYLKLPNVHLGIDPEFYMRDGKKPGKYMGTIDAEEINFATEFLANLTLKEDLPPKILVIHRFTQKMVTNYKNIKVVPEVQFVMHMDGWGGKEHKKSTYKSFIFPEPVQFAGFKIFYKNDTKQTGTTIFTGEELLKLNPRPIYIQYQ